MKDATGLRSGRIEVVYDSMEIGREKVSCRCDCGNELEVNVKNVRSGKSTSCGCSRKGDLSKKKICRIGEKFGRLKIIEEFNSVDGRDRRCVAICDCGSEVNASIASLCRGNTKSCGCYRRELSSRTKHGMSDQPIYFVWSCMRQRCNNKNHSVYRHYGGRGIKVCDRWDRSFSDFLEDMGEMPTPKHEIDRRDNDGDYTPENCHWVTRKENMSNTRASVHLTANGRTETQAEWAGIFRVVPSAICTRLKRGQSFQQIHDYFTSKEFLDKRKQRNGT